MVHKCRRIISKYQISVLLAVYMRSADIAPVSHEDEPHPPNVVHGRM